MKKLLSAMICLVACVVLTISVASAETYTVPTTEIDVYDDYGVEEYLAEDYTSKEIAYQFNCYYCIPFNAKFNIQPGAVICVNLYTDGSVMATQYSRCASMTGGDPCVGFHRYFGCWESDGESGISFYRIYQAYYGTDLTSEPLIAENILSNSDVALNADGLFDLSMNVTLSVGDDGTGVKAGMMRSIAYQDDGTVLFSTEEDFVAEAESIFEKVCARVEAEGYTSEQPLTGKTER